MAECSRARVEDGLHRGVLRDGFGAGVCIARDAKRALRPAENAIGLAGALPSEQIDFFARAKDGNAVNVRMQMTGDAADGAHGDEPRKQAFVALENC